MTKKSTEELQRQLELHLNTISTQQQALVITIEVLLCHLIGPSPDPAKAHQNLREQILAAIANGERGGMDPQDAERRKQMITMHAEELLDAVGEAVGVETSKPGSSGVS